MRRRNRRQGPPAHPVRFESACRCRDLWGTRLPSLPASRLRPLRRRTRSKDSAAAVPTREARPAHAKTPIVEMASYPPCHHRSCTETGAGEVITPPHWSSLVSQAESTKLSNSAGAVPRARVFVLAHDGAPGPLSEPSGRGYRCELRRPEGRCRWASRRGRRSWDRCAANPRHERRAVSSCRSSAAAP